MPELFQRWIHDTVSALSYSCARALEGSEASTLPRAYNDLTEFILRQQAHLPDFLIAPMRMATMGFDFMGCASSGRLFHRRGPESRARQIASWKNSQFSFQRDLMRYYESLATFAFYSRKRISACVSETRPAVSDALDTPGVLTNPDHELETEIIVVGSGPGGAVTSALLAEAGREVLLVEEGPFYSLDSCVPFSLEEMLQKYRNGGQTVALGRNKISYVEGRCVGGGSEINSGLYHRTPPEILENWRKEFQVAALTEHDLEPHFRALEEELSVGLMPGGAPAASLKLQQGATRLGWKSLEVPRWFRFDPTNATKGARQSMTRTFIPRLLKSGGRLLPEMRVERFQREGDRWLVRATHARKGPVRIKAQTLFVCAGAVQTPALLRRSGLGSHIGNSLQLHPTIKITARFREDINSAEMGVPVHQVKEFAPGLTFGCSISTRPYLSLGLLDHDVMRGEVATHWTQMANYYAMITPEGRGSIRPLARYRDPLVRFRLTQNDRGKLAQGARKLCELLFEAGAIALAPAIQGSVMLRTRADLDTLPGMLPVGLASLMTIHLFSSCPMGENKAVCAVDSFGAVHGCANLFVADASVLCTAPGVNPQGSIMALARRNALRFVGKL